MSELCLDSTLRSAYGPKLKVKVEFDGKGRTKQSFKDECNINGIMAKYQKTGAIAHVRRHGLEYGYSSGLSFNESMNIVIKGQAMFEALPSSLRDRFKNDPAQFLDFVQDPENADEMRELGLAKVDSEASAEPAAEVVAEDGSLEESPAA